MKHLRLVIAACTFLCAANANAALFNFTGEIQYHNDVIYTYFTLNEDATNVRVWTDSFQERTNFDPITALWNADTGALLAENDDNPNVNPSTQTFYDSGFTIASLAAGEYLFTVATYANFANGSNLSDGFAYDGQTPIAMADWCQPANYCDMGTSWSVWADGVDDASNPDIPEPATIAMLGLGLIAFGVSKRRSK